MSSPTAEEELHQKRIAEINALYDKRNAEMQALYGDINKAKDELAQAKLEAATTPAQPAPGTTTTTTVTTNVKPQNKDEGGVWVNQYRQVNVAGTIVKTDEQKQYYSKADFDRLTGKHPQDTELKRSAFEVLGYIYEIIEDTRVEN